MIEQHPAVPVDLRARLEAARLDNLALMRTLDRGLPSGTPLPRADVLALGELDADCGEALWALDQSPRQLDVHKMVRETLAALERLPVARQRLREAIPAYPQDLEAEIRASLDPAEAYSQIPGRTSPKRPAQRTAQPAVGRNDPCLCGSGRKYKKCCLMSGAAAASSTMRSVEPAPARPRYHFEPGSYGGRGAFVPSIACKKQGAGGARVLHFVLVKPEMVHDDEEDASAEAEADLEAAFSGARSDPGVPDHVAHHLRSAGYVLVTDPRVVGNSHGATDARAES
jgi:hypothetical protein